MQAVLNTTVEGHQIAPTLVSALGARSGAGENNKAPSLLFLDEVNAVSDSGDGRSNAAFIQNLFLSIAEEETIVGVILTSKPEAADFLLDLNGGKIQPFPGFARDDWKWDDRKKRGIETGWTDVDWTVEQLQALLARKFDKVIGTINTDFLENLA